MNFLRGVLKLIISLVLILLIILYSTIFTVKNIIENQIIAAATTQAIINKNKNIDEKAEEVLTNLEKDEEFEKIIESFFDDYNNKKEDGSREISEKTVDLWFDYVIDHQEVFKIGLDSDTNFDEFKSKEKREEFRESINEGLRNLEDEENSPIAIAVDTYDEITSRDFQFKMIGTILVLVLLLIIISWSPYKWLLPIGVDLIIAGFFVLFEYFVLLFLQTVLFTSADLKFVLDFKIILIYGGVELGCGIVFLIIESIMKKSNLNNTTNSYQNIDYSEPEPVKVNEEKNDKKEINELNSELVDEESIYEDDEKN